MGPREIDPLLVKDHSTENVRLINSKTKSNSIDHNKRRCCCTCQNRRTAIISTVMIVFGVLLTIVMIVYFGIYLNSISNDINPQELPDDYNLVEVSSDGIYTVHYDRSNNNNNNSNSSTDINTGLNATTFANLALTMLPPWYTASRMAINDAIQPSKMNTSNVKYARQTLLKTRDLLDVFSPIYPTHSIWNKIRSLYKDGYELIGYYQDLSHANILYDKKLWKDRKADVLLWKQNFNRFDSKHDIHTFLINGIDSYGCYDHSESHLFWGDELLANNGNGKLPCGNDIATSSLQSLARIQLNNAMSSLQTIMKYDTVLDTTKQEEFHDFRKEIRSFLDEYDLFGTVLLPNINKTNNKRIQKAITTMQQAFKSLGKVNDKWTAYHLYVTKHEHKKTQKQLASDINTSWEDYKLWVVSSGLAGAIQILMEEVA